MSLTPNSIEAIFEEEAPINAGDTMEKEKGKSKDKERDKGKESKQSSAERNVETIFKTSSVNSQNLSALADTKAHIMITVNTLVLSGVLLMLPRVEKGAKPHLIFPLILMVVVSLITIIFATLATRPNVAKRTFSEDDYKESKVNMLFFGNFFTMDFTTYSSIMLKLMSEKDDLYSVMLRNLYEQGFILAKKYRLLKYPMMFLCMVLF